MQILTYKHSYRCNLFKFLNNDIKINASEKKHHIIIIVIVFNYLYFKYENNCTNIKK